MKQVCLLPHTQQLVEMFPLPQCEQLKSFGESALWQPGAKVGDDSWFNVNGMELEGMRHLMNVRVRRCELQLLECSARAEIDLVGKAGIGPCRVDGVGHVAHAKA